MCNGKSAKVLVRENRIGTRAANYLTIASMLMGLAIYGLGYLPTNDWRGVGLGFGFSCVVPLLVLPLSAIALGRKPKEALVAYAIQQKAPIVLLYVIMVAGSAGFAIASVSLLAD